MLCSCAHICSRYAPVKHRVDRAIRAMGNVLPLQMRIRPKRRIRTANRLTTLEIKTATEVGVLDDGGGLRLFINKSGGKHWLMRVMVGKKRVSRGLGTFSEVSLAKAREKADRARRAARKGRDEVSEGRQTAVRAAVTFRDAFDRYFEEVKRPTLKPGRFAERWNVSMETYVFPHIGKRPVAEVTPAEIIKIVQPLWHTKRETATRILQRMSVAFQSAIVRGDRQHANPCAGVRDELGRGRAKVEHRRALPWAQVPAFLAEFLERERVVPVSKHALHFLILTACRSEEVRGAQWPEVNFEDSTWTVPASRMKMKREHVVPLSKEAVAVLQHARTLQRDDCDLIFPSQVGKMLSDNTLSKLLRDNEVDGTPHGFRTSFKVWASENGVRDEVSEAVLAHGDPDKVRAAYRRTTFFGDRKVAMEAWGSFVSGG